MPLPKPHYQPTFTSEQLAEARQVVACHSSPQAQVRRARLALVLAEHPDLSHKEVGALCDLDDETVYKWRRRWTLHGWSLTDAPRSGRVPAKRVGRAFPPAETVLIKALACERPVNEKRRALARLSVYDLCLQAWELGVTMSYSTVWRRLREDALRPWLFQQGLFPRDPRLLEKATPILELYHGRWEGQPLGPRDLVLSADEMTGLQALSRIHPAQPLTTPSQVPLPGRLKRRYDPRVRVEFEYARHGTLCYQAFLNVFTGRVYGEAHDSNGIDTFERSLMHCLQQPQYRDMERVFLIVDNESAHHPNTSPARIRAQDPRVITVHLPTHSSWLNQIELYFSTLHRKALTPADFPSVAALRQRIFSFQLLYNQRAEPFQWQYTRDHLEVYIERLALHEERFAEAAAIIRARRQAQEPAADCLTH